jgi:serine/threonine protein phosphatase PrpC
MQDEGQSDTVDDLAAGGPPLWPVRVDAAGRTHRGKVRPSNQDSFHVARFGRFVQTVTSSLTDPQALEEFENVGYAFSVADGLGGHAAGEVASRRAVALLFDQALRTPDWIFAREDVHLAAVADRWARRFARVNEAVVAEGRADPRLRGMATTLSVALSLGDNLIVAHVGDSPVFLFRRGQLHRLTRDHTTAVPVLPAAPEADARFRIALTHAIGIPDRGGTSDVVRLKLSGGDRLLLCTDGLTDAVGDGEIAERLGRGSASDACVALVDRALEGGGGDNVTVVVAAYQLPEGAPAAPGS